MPNTKCQILAQAILRKQNRTDSYLKVHSQVRSPGLAGCNHTKSSNTSISKTNPQHSTTQHQPSNHCPPLQPPKHSIAKKTTHPWSNCPGPSRTSPAHHITPTPHPHQNAKKNPKPRNPKTQPPHQPNGQPHPNPHLITQHHSHLQRTILQSRERKHATRNTHEHEHEVHHNGSRTRARETKRKGATGSA